MATTKTTEEKFNGTGSQTVFPFTIEYLLTSDLQVFVSNVLQTETTHYSISGTNVTFVTAPSSGTGNVRIARSTGIDKAQAIHTVGSSVRALDLNNNQDQFLFALQERVNTVDGQVGSTAPAGAVNGDRWYDTTSGRTYVYYEGANSSQWVEASPAHLNTSSPQITSISNAQVVSNAAINATKLSFTAAGSSVSRTVDSKLGDVVSVKDFGATGNGSTDDAAAIQAAIDSVLNGGIIFFPKGTYIIGTQLTIRSNNTLVGANRYDSVLQTKAGANITILNDADTGSNKICITDLGFNGNKANVSSGQIINLVKTEDFLVSNCRIVDSKGDAMIIRQCSYGQIVNNNIVNPDNHGISLTKIDDENEPQGNDIQIIGNSIKNPGGSGINISEQNNVTVTGNTVRQTGVPAAGYGGVRFSNDTERCVAGNNAIQGMPRGIFVVGTAGAYNTIDGNVINDSREQGILIEKSNQLITNNTIIDSGRAETGNRAGIQLADYANYPEFQLTITEANITESNPGVFISNAHGLSNNDVVDYNSNGGTNLVTSAGTAEDGTYFFIVNKTDDTFQISATEGGTALEVTNDGNNNQLFRRVTVSELVQIQNNHIIGLGKMDIGIKISSTGDGNLITGNNISGNTSSNNPIANIGNGSTTTPNNAGKNVFRNNHYPNKDTGSGVSAIASASTITLPPDGEIFNITGTNTIGTINGLWAGRTVKLRFSSSGSGVTDSSSIRLAGNFTSDGNGDVLTLIGMGDPTVIAYEVSRSNV